jgi:HEPN domain-containing protein
MSEFERVPSTQDAILIQEYDSDKRPPDGRSLCSMLVRADRSFIAARFLYLAHPGDTALPYFLASLAIELYLKALLVSRLGTLPVELMRGRGGHDLNTLLIRLKDLIPSDSTLSSPDLAKLLKELSKMNLSGRYPNTGFAIRGVTSDFWYRLDEITHYFRGIAPRPNECRDEMQELLKWPTIADPHPVEAARQALRDAFFAFNRPYGGWFITDNLARLKEDGRECE